MSKISKAAPREQTPGDVVTAFREHMTEVLVQNPVYRGHTVIYRNNGRTHQFRIKGFSDRLKIEEVTS